MATYSTQIQTGGPDGSWAEDSQLEIHIGNRSIVVPDGESAANGTTVTWSGPNGSGSVTFFDRDNFQGTAQFPGEGPVGYRGRRTG
jgi:hypothetical protein